MAKLFTTSTTPKPRRPVPRFQAWVDHRTGSLFLVGLVHAAGNAVALGSIMGYGMLIRLYGDSPYQDWYSPSLQYRDWWPSPPRATDSAKL